MFQNLNIKKIPETTKDKLVKQGRPLLVVAATNKKTISKHAEISEIYVTLEDQKYDIILEAQNNTPYSCYVSTYKIICMKIFEWKCDQLFQELLNCGTVIHDKTST